MSRANRRRRELNRARKDVAVAETRAWLAEQQVRPEVIAHRQAQDSDGELVKRIAADKAAQAGRLIAAGFIRLHDGADGAGQWANPRRRIAVIHSVDRMPDGHLWGHVSVSRADRTLPGWLDVRDAQWLLYPGDYGVVVVAPKTEHVNLREVAHVWTCLDRPTVPDFTFGLGTI